MKRLLYLAALTMVATLLLASAAMAQISPAPGNTGAYGCPEEAPIVATIAGDPGEGSLQCFATEEEAAAYRASGGVPQDEPEQYVAPTAPQYTPPTTTAPTATTTTTAPTATTATTATATGLPATGGPALLLPAAGLLLVAGLVGLKMVRRP